MVRDYDQQLNQENFTVLRAVGDKVIVGGLFLHIFILLNPDMM
jgi:hypothetical protein